MQLYVQHVFLLLNNDTQKHFLNFTLYHMQLLFSD